MIKYLSNFIHIIEDDKLNIVERWISEEKVLEILKKKDIDKEYFIANYAIKVVEYYIGVVNGSQVIGNCPVIQKLLEYLKNKNITSAELYMICIHFRESISHTMFEKVIMTHDLYKSICYVFNENLKGVLEHYNNTVNELRDEKEYYYKLSTIDHLTGIYNRQKLDELFTAELKRVQRYHHDLSVILIDIDYFKNINDTLGHDTGDIVLKELSLFIKNSLREFDIFARWGGEEFVLLLPETNYDNAMIKSNQLCKLISEHDFKINRKITCSFGVTSAEKDDTEKSIFKKVDKALYEAKETGRNKVVGL